MAGKKSEPRDENCFAQALRTLLRTQVGEGTLETLKAQARDSLRADMTNDEAIAMALIRRAIEGDAAAAKYICEAARRCEESGKEKSAPFRLTLRVVKDGD